MLYQSVLAAWPFTVTKKKIFFTLRKEPAKVCVLVAARQVKWVWMQQTSPQVSTRTYREEKTTLQFVGEAVMQGGGFISTGKLMQLFWSHSGNIVS